tara:strand:- start:35 stop:799 length:765 start_codon:yes stop_codon:yes gene_type:complete
MSYQDPLVSIIMNCYNSDKFLKEAIDSVYAQSYQNWEIIFWDNNSSDNSAKIAQSFDSRLKYFKAVDTTPLYEARNLALERCNGDYVGFIDCDDIWVKSKLDKQINYALKGFDFIYGGYDLIDTDGRKTSEELKHLVSGNITNTLFRRNPISIGSVLIKRSLFKKNQFDPIYELLGDYDMWVRLSMKHHIKVISEIVEHSRQHENNFSITLNNRWLIERRYFYKKHCSFSNFFKYPWLIYYIIRTEILGMMGRR